MSADMGAEVAAVLTEVERAEILRAGFSTHDHLLQRDPTLAAVERIIAVRMEAAKAEAWEEGARAGRDDWGAPLRANPYRADALDPGARP